MIVFGICVGSEERLAAMARPGIEQACGRDSLVLERRGEASIFEAYNSMLVEAGRLDDLEALVLIHDDTEILDPDFGAKLRAAFAGEAVAVVGAIGGSGVSSLRWWDAERTGRVVWRERGVDDSHVEQVGPRTGNVDCVDGLLMGLSPWAVRNVTFDAQTFDGFHGYDLDYCFQVRQRGRSVVVADFDVCHHARRGTTDHTAYLRADLRWRAKWGFTTRRALRLRLALLRPRVLARGAVTRLRGTHPRAAGPDGDVAG